MRTVVVTGAGGGMGRATCRLLTESGFRVFGLDLRSEPAEGWQFLETDVTDQSSVERAAEAVKAAAGRVDAIVHMAGIYRLDSLLEIPEEEWEQVFAVNLSGVYRVNRAFCPLLEECARIVITSSELAPLDPLPFTGIYAISKAALEKYAFSLRMEMQLTGQSVSVIRPGAVKTGLLRVSTRQLERFSEKTERYACNAARFRQIVDRVETRSVPPEKIAKTALRALTARRPKYVYNINRNGALRLLNALPARVQTAIIRRILR